MHRGKELSVDELLELITNLFLYVTNDAIMGITVKISSFVKYTFYLKINLKISLASGPQ